MTQEDHEIQRNKPHDLNRVSRGTRLRKVHTTRCQQQLPGHQTEVDVEFLIFRGKDGKPIRRYQYTAIDDATRVRALEVHNRHAQFHWHVEDCGIRHA